MQHLQRRFVGMEHLTAKQFPVERIVNRRQVVCRSPQNPVGHGLSAQRNALTFQLLLLTVQRRSHDKLLHHDVGNGFCCSEAAPNDRLLPICTGNGSFNPLGITPAAGICVIAMLHYNHLCRDDLELADNLFPDLLHGLPADGTFQLFLRDMMLNDLCRHTFREVIQGVFMLLVAFVSRDKGFLLILGSLMVRDDLCLVEQEAQLLAAVIHGLLAGCAEPLVLRQSQRFRQRVDLLFQLRYLALGRLQVGLKLLVFLAGNHVGSILFGFLCHAFPSVLRRFVALFLLLS